MESPLFGSPFGRPVEGSVADPAPGSEFEIFVPALRIWKLTGLRFNLTTDSTAANRVVRAIGKNSLGIFSLSSSPLDHVASTSISYSFGSLGYTAGLRASELFLPTPDLLLLPGSSVLVSIDERQVTDQLSAIFYQVEEWISGD